MIGNSRLLMAAILATAGFAIVPGQATAQPSFDCAKANAPVEKMICADSELSRLDGQMGRLYFARRNAVQGEARKEIVEEQVRWLGYRFPLCDLPQRGVIGAEAALRIRPCLVDLYERRIAQLEPVDASAPPPANVAGNWMFVTSGGAMTIEQRERGRYAIEIETVSGTSFHTCNVSVTDAEYASGVISAQIEEDDFSLTPPRKGICAITVTFAGDRAILSATGNVCRSFCGARGIFDGSYKRRR